MKAVTELGFSSFNQADVLFLADRRRKWGSKRTYCSLWGTDIESVRKETEREREVVFAQAVFLSRTPYSAVLGTWQIDCQSEWNINTPQPLSLPKELQLQSRQGGSSENVCVCVCVCLTANAMCVSASVCPWLHNCCAHVRTNEGDEMWK